MPTFDLGSLKLSAPGGYDVKMAVVAAPFVPEDSDGPSFARNVVIVMEPISRGIGAEEYADRQLNELARSKALFQAVKRETISLMGQTCPLVQSDAVGPEGMFLSSLSAYIVTETTALTLTATDVRGARFTQSRPEFIKIFQSITGTLPE